MAILVIAMSLFLTGRSGSVKFAKKQEWLPFPKSPKSLRALAQKAKHCKNCDLWRTGTQTVFGAGRSRAKIMMIGEQPGHEEDLQGKPFVGPAGRLFNRLLRESGIDIARRTVAKYREAMRIPSSVQRRREKQAVPVV